MALAVEYVGLRRSGGPEIDAVAEVAIVNAGNEVPVSSYPGNILSSFLPVVTKSFS